ncbi:hypothetical protein V8C26DRAFT_390564 [Trichoderma gracile]
MASNSLQEARANHEGIIYVVSRMDWYWHLAELLLDGNESESAPSALRSEMEKHIIDLYRKLLLYQMKSVCRYYRQRRPTIWRDAIRADDWAGQMDDIRNAEATVQEDSRVFNALKVQRRLDEIDRGSQVLRGDIQEIWPKIQEQILSKEAEKCLKDLRVTDPRHDKMRIEDTNGGLLQGAYDWAIKHDAFIAWQDEKENHLLWIKGDPGKGKTMLLCGIIEELQICGTRPCYFFCQATDPRLNNATAVLRGLIYLLVVTNRQLLSPIQEKYDQAGTALFQDVNAWAVLSQMFIQLLEDPGLQGQILIIDALDECQTDLERLLDLIVVRSANFHVKWIVSSRNEPGIEGKLRTLSQKIRLSLEVNEQSVSEAVRTYISHKADQLRKAKGLDEETDTKIRTYLTDNARGTFLWVALVCKELLKMGVRKRHLLKKMTEFPSDLKPLYTRMMRQIRESEESDLCERILEVVAIAYRPVTLTELSSLLDIQDDFSGEDLEELVGSCGSFLVVRDDVVRFVHQSAQDFLFSDEEFASRIGSQHYRLFSRSMEILSASLRRDMYNLRYPGALIEEHTQGQEPDVLKHARYSCLHWVDHLKAVNDRDGEKKMQSFQDDGILHRFLSTKLLNWLEALSLLQKMPDAARAVGILRRLSTDYDCTMRNLIEDVYHFLLYHQVGIGLAPLQVYSSAIIFTPESSLIRQLYEKTEGPKWITARPDMPSGWTARLQYLDEHPGSVIALAFSPDNTQIASGLSDAIARVWGTETGACLHVFKCHSFIESLAFAPDSKRLATGLLTGLEIWDLMSGTKLHAFIHANYMHVSVMASASDRAQLSALCKGLIRTWDLDDGVELKAHELGEKRCHDIAYSPDGTLLAFVSDAKGVQHIWNLTANKHLAIADVADDEELLSWSARFSSDASRLAVPTLSCIYIFEASTSEHLQTLEEDLDASMSFGFLADPKRLMSVSKDTSFRIWDTTTGTCLRQLSRDGLPHTTYLAVPSPDGMLIAETQRGSKASGVQLWEMTTKPLSNSITGESTEELTAIALSPDGAQIATASISRTGGNMIKIQDSFTGARTEFPWSGTTIDYLAFFPDSNRLASGGEDIIQIWDTATGLNVQTIETESLTVASSHGMIRPFSSAIAISSNGDLVAASFTHHQEAAMWDLTSTEILQRFRLMTDNVADRFVAAAFLSDDARLGFVSRKGAVYICDTNTGGVQVFQHFFEPLDCYQPCPLQLRKELQVLDGESEDNDEPQKQVQPRMFDTSGFKASRDGTWILKGQQRVLWLPPDYRPSKVVSHDGSVAIRFGGSQSLLLRFAVDELNTLLS